MRYFYIFFIMCLCLTTNLYGFISAWRAATAYKSNDFEKAQQLYQDMVVNNPSDWDALFNLGKTAYKLNNFLTAAQCFDKVSHAESLSSDKRAQAYFQLGDARMQLQRYQDALWAYENALSLDPANQHTQQRIKQVKKIIEEQEKKKKTEQSEKDKKNKEQPHNNDNRDQLKSGEQQQRDQEGKSTEEQAPNKQSENNQTTEQKNRADDNKKTSTADEEQRDRQQAKESDNKKQEHKKPVDHQAKHTTQDSSKDTGEDEELQEEPMSTYGNLDEQDISLLQEIEAAQSETGKREMQRYIKNSLPAAHGYKNW